MGGEGGLTKPGCSLEAPGPAFISLLGLSGCGSTKALVWAVLLPGLQARVNVKWPQGSALSTPAEVSNCPDVPGLCGHHALGH